MELLDLYSYIISNWISGGNLINREKISSLGIKPTYDRVLTKKYIKKIWCVYSVPVNFDKNLSQIIRSEMFKTNPTVRTVIHTYNNPVNINTTSDTYRRQFASASKDYNQYKEVFSTLKDDEKLTGKSVINPETGRKLYISANDLKRIRDKYDSYAYVFSHKNNGGEFTSSYYFIEANAKTSKEMRSYKKNLMDILRSLEIYPKELQGNISQYLANFTPATYLHEDVRKVGTMLLSDENLASFMPYKNRGLVGKSGILLGIDWLSKFPFSLNFFESSAGQISMILGRTGSGKTFHAFMLCLALIAKKHHCSAIDIKGGEWEKLKRYVRALVISMDDSNPRFVNTLRLDDLKITSKNCEELYNMAVRATVQFLSIMVNLGPNEGNPLDLEAILETAVNKLYSINEIYSNRPHTFKKTKDLKYDMIMPIISELEGTKSYDESYRALCRIIRIRCSMYFSAEGRYKDAFRNEVTTQEVLDAPLVIYSFNKNRDTMLDTLDTLRVFMVQHLDNKKQSIRKEEGKHTAAFYEELQRCDQFSKLLLAISHSVTGSRSNNVIIFLLLNALSIFDNKDAAPIKSNISTIIAGLLNSADIEKLDKEFDCGEIVPYLNKIKDDNKFTNCFAIKYNTGKTRDKTIFKVIVPPEMEEELRTKDVVA